MEKPKDQKIERADIDEQQLVERLRKGQEWAFHALVDRYQRSLMNIAYSITYDTEESLEIVQDVFVIVFKKIHTFREEARLITWLRKITINQCLNWKRKWKRRFKWHHDALTTESERKMHPQTTVQDTPETAVREKQMKANIMEAVQKLPEKLKIVFILNALEGLSYEEIARTLDIKKGTVSSRIYTARKQLMGMLGTAV